MKTISKKEICRLLIFAMSATGVIACSHSSSSSPNAAAANMNATLLQTPVIIGSIPLSPSSNLNPVVTGTAGANASVQLFADPACATAAVGVGQADQAGQFNITVAMTANTTETLYAQTTANGQTSMCSPTSVTYFADTTPPTPLIFTQVVSTSNINAPIVEGNTSPGYNVFLFSDAACKNAIGATVAGSDGYFEFHAIVATDSNTTFYGKVEDSAGVMSACSTSNISYSSTPAPTPAPALAAPTITAVTTTTTPGVFATANEPLITASYSYTVDNILTVTPTLYVFQYFNNALCTGSPVATEATESVGTVVPNPTSIWSINANYTATASTNLSAPSPLNLFSANYYTITNNGEVTSACSTYVTTTNNGAPDDPLIISHAIHITAATSPQPPYNGPPLYDGSYQFIGRTSPNASYSIYTSMSGCVGVPLFTGLADQNGYFTYDYQLGPTNQNFALTTKADVLLGAPLYIQSARTPPGSTTPAYSSCTQLPLY